MNMVQNVGLSKSEEEHLVAFCAKRPDWRTLCLSARMFDEGDGSRVHKYPKTHPYITGMQFTLKYLSRFAPLKVLDIGSPLQQNVALACFPGIDVTVVDVRPIDDALTLGLQYMKGSATKLPYDGRAWKWVTSLWVMGHVGDGRYGDALDADGDLHMLREIHRILEYRGTAIIGVGLLDVECVNVYNMHRIYSWEWLRRAFADTGFTIEQEVELPVSDDWFLDREILPTENIKRRDGFYGLVVARKE